MKSEKDISTTFLVQIGENVKRLRKKAEFSLEDLGLEVGLTRMQVHRIEKGYNITALTILKLSIALKVSPKDLLKFDYDFKKDDLEKLVNNNKANRTKIKEKKTSN